MGYPAALYAAQAEELRPALEAQARSRVGRDGHYLAQDAIIEGFNSLEQFDPLTGISGLAAWLYAILRRRCAQALRERNRDSRCSIRYSEEMLEDSRWQAVVADERDAELRSEARFRMRHAQLTPSQFEAIADLLNGLTREQSAARLGISVEAVKKRRRLAIRQLRRVPIGIYESCDLDKSAWKNYAFVHVYHKPTSTGSALAREKLAAMKLPAIRPRRIPVEAGTR